MFQFSFRGGISEKEEMLLFGQCYGVEPGLKQVEESSQVDRPDKDALLCCPGDWPDLRAYVISLCSRGHSDIPSLGLGWPSRSEIALREGEALRPIYPGLKIPLE